MVLREAGKLTGLHFVSLWGLTGLTSIEIAADFVAIGGVTPYTQLLENKLLVRRLPSLAEAARATGATAIQNRGTLGGNIANASPAADSPPVLLAHSAALELMSCRGTRWIDYEHFHSGYKTTRLEKDEIIARIRIPITRGIKSYFRKVGTRNAQAISKVVVAATAVTHRNKIERLRFAVGSLAPFPKICTHVQAFLVGKSLNSSVVAAACQELLSDIEPIDDIRSSAYYRKRVAQNCLREFLEGLCQ